MQYPIPAIALGLLLAAALPATAQEQAADTETGTQTDTATETEDATEAPASEDAGAAGDTVPTNQPGGLSTGQPVDENGEPLGEAYISGEHGDWQIRCVRTPQEEDPCQLYQLLEDGQGASVAEITLFPIPNGGNVAAGATIMTPLETLLTEQITLSIDGGTGRKYPFSFCTPQGCVSRIGFAAGDIAAFRAGNTATISIVPAAAPDQKVDLRVSLSGFTAGYASLTE